MLQTFIIFAASASAIACPPKPCSDSPYSGDQVAFRSDFRASTFKPSAQAETALDVDSQGNIIVVWSSRKQQEGRSAVYMQRFTPEGVAIGSETQLNLWTKSHQVSPVIASSRFGVTWIGWQSHGQDGYAGSIIARRFVSPNQSRSNEVTGSSELLINQEWIGDQVSPAVAALSDGSAVFAWTSAIAPGVPQQIRARLFGAQGDPIADEFAVAPAGAGNRTESLPSVAVSRDDSIAIVFAIADDRGNPAGIRMQRFDRCGMRLGAEVAIAADAPRAPIEPVVAATDFGYVVAWESAQPDGEDYDVLAQRLDGEGNALGASFRANSSTAGLQNAPAIAARPDHFIIAWNSDDGDKNGVFAQSFSNDGRSIGAPIRINSATKGDQSMRQATSTHRLAFEPNGTLLCAWSGDAKLGDATAAHVSMLSPAPLDLRAQHQGVTAEMAPASSPDEHTLASAQASGSPEPHQPPTFDPRLIDKGNRDVIQGINEIGFTGILSTGWTPPDPHMAVGPDHVVLMTNGAIAFFTKAGEFQFQDQIEGAGGFWGSLGTTNFVFDPEVLYDPLSGRFFAMASEQAPTSQSFILIAVSDDSDPNGNWFKYRFNTTSLGGATYDSPNIAVDANVVYISGDNIASGTYPVFMYDKASLLVGAPPAITQTAVLPTTTQSAGMPPVGFDNPPALYFIEHKEAASNTQVRLIALTDPLGTPTFTILNMNVATYGPPENPPQMGTTVRPTTFDARFWSCAYRNGSLWAAHHINSARVVVRWYEFAMNGWPTSGNPPTLVQSGTIDPGGTVRTYFCAITADAQNNAALVFARSSPTEFISMQTAYRSHNDPPNTFQPMVQRQINSGAYTAAARWGDYAGMKVDPVDGHTMWAHHEYALGNAWRTWVQSFLPALPCPADIAPPGIPKGDGVVNSADLLLVINNWGLCAGCPADINNDAAVNVADLLIVINAWGPCP